MQTNVFFGVMDEIFKFEVLDDKDIWLFATLTAIVWESRSMLIHGDLVAMKKVVVLELAINEFFYSIWVSYRVLLHLMQFY